MKSRLTGKQRAFCDYYIESLNATESAIRAGYSKKTAAETGYENLRKPHIKAYIEKRLKQLEDERIAKADEVLKHLTSMMRGEIDEEVVVVESLGDYESKARILKKQVSARERIKAAELLGKRYSLFTDKVDLNADVGVQIIDDIEVDADEDG